MVVKYLTCQFDQTRNIFFAFLYLRFDKFAPADVRQSIEKSWMDELDEAAVLVAVVCVMIAVFQSLRRRTYLTRQSLNASTASAWTKLFEDRGYFFFMNVMLL